MTPSSSSTTSIRSTSHTSKNLGFLGTSLANATRSKRVLTCSGGGPGDFKSPTGFSYASNCEESQRGSMQYLYCNGKDPQAWTDLYEIEGPQDYIGGFPSAGLPTFGLLSSSNARIRNTAVADLYSRMREGNLDMGSSVAEARAAAKSAEERLQHASRYVEPRSLPPWKALATLTGGAYLAWKYAIAPTISDAWSAANFVIRAADDPVMVATGRARMKGAPLDTVLSGTGYALRQSHDRYWEVKFKVRYKHSSTGLATISSMTSLNPALWIWNKTSLSFVVDWLFDVGGYLESMEASLGLGLEVLSVEESFFYRQKSVESYVGECWVPQGGSSWIRCNGKLERSFQSSEFHRTVGALLPRPSITPHLVGEMGSMGSSRLLSAAALLSNLLRK